METISGSDLMDETMPEDEPQTVPEPKEEMHTGDQNPTISGNDTGTTGNGTDALPSGDAAVTLPDAIAMDNEQFETLIAKQEEIHESIQIQTCVIALLLGVLIGIIYVRGLSRFVRGV